MKEPENNHCELNLILLENGNLAPSFEAKKELSSQQLSTQEKFYNSFKENPVEALFQLGFMETKGILSSTLNFWHCFSLLFVNALRLTEHLDIKRDKVVIPFDEELCLKLLSDAPFFTGSEFLNIELLRRYWIELEKFYREKIKDYKGSAADLLRSYSEQINIADKIYFHMVENKKGSSTPFAFLATYSSGLNDKGIATHKPLKGVMDEYSGKQSKLVQMLGSVYRVAGKSSYIKSLLDNGEIFYPVGVDTSEAFTFLSETPLYEECGILCRIPNWWKSAKKGVRIKAKFGSKGRSFLGKEALVDFSAELTFDGMPLTPEEIEKIISDSSSLVLIKGKWAAMDKDKLKSTLDKWKEIQSLMSDGDLSFAEAAKIASGMDENISSTFYDEGTPVDFEFGDWMQSVLQKMKNPSEISSFKTGEGFKAQLRPYQTDGVNWLGFLSSMNFGACLADDMGLGKTVQVIALLSAECESQLKKERGVSLLVVPASLMHNWSAEIKKFCPSMKFVIAHPSNKDQFNIENPSEDEINKYTLIITTYGFVRKYKHFQERKWKYVIIDEAQAIKNHSSQQTKAVKTLKADKRIALTGTPIENTLWDLWSIFDFLNPGLMGSAAQFKRLTSEKSEHVYGKIRKVISPYILRRLKSDKKIISDLPDKIEMDTFTRLSKKQLILYRKHLDELTYLLEENVEGIEKKGLVLAAIMKFKQICNHPSQLTGDKEYSESDSGKFERLREICEVIRDKREKVLVFTQFKEMTEPLDNYLSSVFGAKGFSLHGATSIKKRKEMVDSFQSDEYYPYFVLSLKAGGTGLNLTKANHVVHFDRWWNPAVENQATDRAFRIGQKKSVVAHKFICEGTFEEKIDEMLKEKSKLSRSILSDADGLNLTELTNDEIIKLFKPGNIYE
ncbi:MAG TPA: ATP-dependent helicase [Lentisphaeria bacterium]|nr:MAG: helicase SNF2 [Lentisphaerae bacterium GWF2_38_69]HBM16140.1 ATP-dependent helicase [Lentisphaeria bacterium]